MSAHTSFPVPFVEMRGIHKSFGEVKANRDINFRALGGEICALLGENGAGKSTLMNILSGIYTPERGTIFVHGKAHRFTSPSDAISAGIGMIYQHFKLVEVMTAWENIILGQPESFFLHPQRIISKLNDLARQNGFPLDVRKRICDMSVSEKQAVEIIKVLYRGANILVLDEPTAVLTPQETRQLFAILKRMRDDGKAIIIITHKLNEVMEISDSVTVLHTGTTAGTVRTADTSERELTNMMVGRQVNLSITRTVANKKPDVMQVSGLSVIDDSQVTKLNELSFSLHGGEVLGVAGVSGSGQKELCETLAGLQKASGGDIFYQNESLLGLHPREIAKRGVYMSFVPEDRLGMGLIASMDIVDNILLKDYHNQHSFLLSRSPALAQANSLIDRLSIKTPGVHHAVKKLSGGNIQKVLLGREIDGHPNVLITAYATRGLDIASSHVIYDLINAEKERGVAILYVGEDLDVLLGLCDRIMVLCQGRCTGIVKARETDKETLGYLMSGAKTQPQEEWAC